MKWLSIWGAVFLSVSSILAQTTNGLSNAEIQGRQLAKQLCETAPTLNLTNEGTVEIRSAGGLKKNYPIKFETIVSATNWQSVYQVIFTHYDNSNNFGDEREIITVNHTDGGLNNYKRESHFINGMKGDGMMIIEPASGTIGVLPNKRTTAPFAGSDFWICDLGLEFFHWPDQKVIKHETRRTRACAVLESTNPDTSADGYSRVDTWIDNETLGVVHAEAYDTKGKLLKVFDPKSFKKVNGQWELEDMEIRNVQTGSRTVIKFDLDSRS